MAIFVSKVAEGASTTFAINERTGGRKLANALRNLAVPDNPALVQQIIGLEGELSALDAEISRQEAEMNALVNLGDPRFHTSLIRQV